MQPQRHVGQCADVIEAHHLVGRVCHRRAGLQRREVLRRDPIIGRLAELVQQAMAHAGQIELLVDPPSRHHSNHGRMQLVSILPGDELDLGHCIVGAVGVLQFDVVVSRLKSEYNVEAIYEAVNVSTARWVEGTDVKKFEEFKRKNEVNLALDGGDNLTYIAPTMVNLRLAQERHPDVQFRQTREH